MELDRTAVPAMNVLIDALKNTYDEVNFVKLNLHKLSIISFKDSCTIWLARILVIHIILIKIQFYNSGNLMLSPWNLHL